MMVSTPVWTGDKVAFVDALFDWFRAVGEAKYGEQVTQLEHALQTADNARRAHATEAEIVAALLHDVGHFLVYEHRTQNDFLDRDPGHELVGAKWLARCFPPHVMDPVRLHVPAKRWLCTTDALYWERLSTASKRSLELQGGIMEPEEVTAFEAQEGWASSVALRKWDDLGKVPGQEVPDLQSYRALLLKLLTD